MKQSIAIIIALVCISPMGYSQKQDYESILKELESTTGVERIRVLNKLANQDLYNNQELCRQRAWEMVDSAKVYNHDALTGWGYRYIGLSYAFEGTSDSAIYYYKKCMPFFDTPKEQGWSYYNIATIFEGQALWDSTEYYLNIAEKLFIQDTSATVQIGSIYSLKGNIAATKGDHSIATQHYMKALKYMEKAGDQIRYADMLRKLGETYGFLNQYDKAIEVQRQSIALYDANNDPYYGSLALGDIGNSHHALNNIDSAKYYFNKAIDQSRAVNHDWVTGTSLHRLASIHAGEGNMKLARQQYQEAVDIHEKANDTYSIVFVSERHAKAEYDAKNYSEVLDLTKKNIPLAENADLFGLKSKLLKWQSLAQESLGQYQGALLAFKEHQFIQDSLTSKDRSENLQELLVQYETEKKEKELIIAQAENDRKSARNKILSIGLIGIITSAFIFINSLRIKRRNDRIIFSQEKELEIEKRKFIEQELEFKKKEITAKALQLARKNEFLLSLEGELMELKSTVDTKAKMSSERIRRMIQHDSNENEDWDQFAKEFSSIHQEFIDKLAAKHGSFTTNDLRLVSLMKMNLSSKDIASTLRISPDGIKKARYRLRKKMGIESQVDLQDYLLNFG